MSRITRLSSLRVGPSPLAVALSIAIAWHPQQHSSGRLAKPEVQVASFNVSRQAHKYCGPFGVQIVDFCTYMVMDAGMGFRRVHV